MANGHVKQEIGGPVENLELTAISGEKTSLRTVLWGKKGGVIVFWSGVCSHCTRYDSYLNGFSQQHPELGMAAVASREGETLLQLRTVAAQRKLVFPILYDRDGQVARQWSAHHTPRVFLINADRLLIYRGAFDNYKYSRDREYMAYLEPAIDEFLAGKPVSRPESASFGCAVQSVYYHVPKAL
jgi:peroxiredoxin